MKVLAQSSFGRERQKMKIAAQNPRVRQAEVTTILTVTRNGTRLTTTMVMMTNPQIPPGCVSSASRMRITIPVRSLRSTWLARGVGIMVGALSR